MLTLYILFIRYNSVETNILILKGNVKNLQDESIAINEFSCLREFYKINFETGFIYTIDNRYMLQI